MAGRHDVRRPARYDDGVPDEAAPAMTKTQQLGLLKAAASRAYAAWKAAVDAGKAPDEVAEKKRAYDAALQRIETHEPGARAH